MSIHELEGQAGVDRETMFTARRQTNFIKAFKQMI